MHTDITVLFQVLFILASLLPFYLKFSSFLRHSYVESLADLKNLIDFMCWHNTNSNIHSKEAFRRYYGPNAANSAITRAHYLNRSLNRSASLLRHRARGRKKLTLDRDFSSIAFDARKHKRFIDCGVL